MVKLKKKMNPTQKQLSIYEKVPSDPKTVPKRTVNGVGGYVMYPRRICEDHRE
ncbi:MAG: hypothetical protein GOP50_06890 [Candidatus Heimdallarchaeota archaeon]|nr:hypothetical protein [Candidatus Heimdallarchaeota archaeon]